MDRFAEYRTGRNEPCTADRVRRLQAAAAVAVWFVTCATASASPTMIRVGYAGCVPCHASPQGGGLLTDYGRGVDLAQSLFVREYRPRAKRERVRFVQDVRALAGVQQRAHLPMGEGPGTAEMQFWHRASLVIGRASVDTVLALDMQPVLNQPAVETPTVSALRASWSYRPRTGIELSIGKDALPAPLGLAEPRNVLRTAVEPGVSVAPTQMKLFWWTGRVSLTPYLFGPGGDDATGSASIGAGLHGGIDLWRQRAVVGATARVSRSDARDVDRHGVFARLGFGAWGILTEYERLSQRSSETGAGTGDAGFAMVFAAPREWLVASVSAQYVDTPDTLTPDVYQIAPSVQLRISDKLTLVATEREHLGPRGSSRQRSFSIRLYMKTVPR